MVVQGIFLRKDTHTEYLIYLVVAKHKFSIVYIEFQYNLQLKNSKILQFSFP